MKKILLIIVFLLGIIFADQFPIDRENCMITKINGFNYIVLSSAYNSWRNDHNYTGLHRAYDIPCKNGTTFRAARDGRVKEVAYGYTHEQVDGTWRTNYGNYVIIKQLNGESQLYAHAEKICVRENEEIAEGEMLGRVGSTGLVDKWGRQIIAPHLHYEFRNIYGEKINPGSFWDLPKDEYHHCFTVLDQNK